MNTDPDSYWLSGTRRARNLNTDPDSYRDEHGTPNDEVAVSTVRCQI